MGVAGAGYEMMKHREKPQEVSPNNSQLFPPRFTRIAEPAPLPG
jgi:hypothetical protein